MGKDDRLGGCCAKVVQCQYSSECLAALAAAAAAAVVDGQ